MSVSKTRSVLLLLALPAAGPGCVWYGDHSMTRVWADHNTLDRPAFFIERLSQAPPPRERVERFRWMYGVGPGAPFLAPQPVFVPADPSIPPVAPALPGASPPPAAPPAAPPAEPPGRLVPPPPEAGDVHAPRPRRSLAWLFGGGRG